MDPTVPVAASLLQPVIQGAFNKAAVDSANRANVGLWREQANYNSPINQMRRLEAAGLNPNLVYGQVADSKMATPPTMQAPRYEAPNLQESLIAHQQVVNMQEQNKLIRAQAGEVAARTAVANSEAEYKQYENKLLKDSGALRTDTPIVKAGGRVSAYVRQNFVEPVNETFKKSSLWQSVLDKVSDISEFVTKTGSTTPYMRNKLNERGGKK